MVGDLDAQALLAHRGPETITAAATGAGRPQRRSMRRKLGRPPPPQEVAAARYLAARLRADRLERLAVNDSLTLLGAAARFERQPEAARRRRGQATDPLRVRAGRRDDRDRLHIAAPRPPGHEPPVLDGRLHRMAVALLERDGLHLRA